MAVTIHQSPQPFTPSDNPIVWVFSSNQTAQANFSYLVSVYINGALDSDNIVFPEDGIYAEFDASGIVSRNTQAPVISQEPIEDAQNYCTSYIIITERYGSPPASQASATSSTITCWKARITDEAFEVYDDADYIMGSATTVLPVTEFPTTINPKIRVDEQHRLMFLSNNDTITDIEYLLYDENDIGIASDSISGTWVFPVASLNISPSVIIAETGIVLASFEEAAYYIVKIFPTTANTVTYRIDMNTNHRYDYAVRLHFLSMIGCIEGFSFDLIARQSSDVMSEGYQRKFGYISGDNFFFDSNRGTDIDIAKITTKKLTVESDWLLQDEQNWLVENMYDSPAVYIEQTDYDLKLVKVTNTSYAPMIQENDTLISEKVELIVGKKTSMVL
jgi:hypothetical protein